MELEGTHFVDQRTGEGANPEVLASYAANLETLHDAITAHYDTLEALCQAYLEAGCEIFGMQTGILSHITGEEYRVVAIKTPIEGLEAGAMFALEDTYCREVVKAERTLAFPQVGVSKTLCGHPVYTNLGLEAYISAPIYVEGQLYGTINFTSTEPRTQGFSRAERNIIDMMAKAAGNFVEQLEAKRALQDKSTQLLAVNDKLKQFVGIVAHDLRNPIGTMEAYGRALLRSDDWTDKARNFATRLVRVAEQSRKLVSDLLDISALQAGQVKVERETFEMSAVVDDLMLTAESLLADKQITAEVQLDVGTAYGDPSRVGQVLANLVANAVKFTDEGGRITISSRAQGEHTELRVEDTGVGMEPDLVERLRAGADKISTRGTRGETGSGFGLKLVREVLAAHGTTLQIDSEPGRGSCFSFRLPRVDPGK